jgi:hypothetical protein
VQQLVHDALRDGVDERLTVRAELRELRAEAFELAPPDVFCEVAQRGHERVDLAGRTFCAVAVDLRRKDLADLADLAAAPFGGTLRVLLQVVEVEERDVRDIADTRIDVARQGHVDDQQRPPVATRHHHLDHRPLDEHLRRPGRREDDVDVDECVGDVRERDRPAADGRGEPRPAFDRAVRDHDLRDSA